MFFRLENKFDQYQYITFHDCHCGSGRRFYCSFFDLTAEGHIQGKAEKTQLNTIQSKYMYQFTEFSYLS